MTHDEAIQILDAYVDAELDIVSTLAVEAHVGACDECTAWLLERRSLLAQIKSAQLRYAAPADLTRRVAARYRPAHRRWYRRQPAAWAAGWVLVVCGFLMGQFFASGADVRDQLVSAHVRADLSAHPIDVVSTDHHTVKPWLAGKLSYSPPVPELKSGGDGLLGARLDTINSVRVAVLVYKHGNHAVDVFVWPNSAIRFGMASGASKDGFHVVVADSGAFRVAIVSDLSVDDLRAFRERWTAAAEH
jgi:anti-sigma factor RsiW